MILTYYGLLFLLGLPFLGLRAPALFAWACAWAVAAPVASQLLRPHLPVRGGLQPDVRTSSRTPATWSPSCWSPATTRT